MQSKAATVAQYLAELPPDRRAVVTDVRRVILDNLDADYEEGMQYGMISYHVPHRIYPAGYHCNPKQPLPFAALAAQKNHFAVYIMGLYDDAAGEAALRAAWAQTGKKLDMGKCCIRFKRVEDLALDVLGAALRKLPAKAYIARYEAALRPAGRRPAGKPSTATAAAKAKPKTGTQKTATKRPVAKKAATNKVAARKTGARKTGTSRR